MSDDAKVSTPQRTDDEDRQAWLRGVAADMARLDRSSSAERAADVLRRSITEGALRPGAQLSEIELTEVLQVSRNTLREAFRLLTHEGLLVYKLHRGVFVPELDERDVVDLFRLRRVLEVDVVRGLADRDSALPASRLEPLHADVESAKAAALAGTWPAVGTANMGFHRHLIGLADSPRLDAITSRLLAELRLLFHVMATPRELHEPYIARNQAILELLEARDYEQAADDLHRYLVDSEKGLLAAFKAR
ncbi:DNA-binding GntR family transcriptional regulator [Kribbella voronezhensis]|uniref:DNA-binding GntR family transcriptional regulator n=1 Tax=Kribbella voronezhensis TaxID=2512212 RepID=A0A4R7TG76_9ACTN|nr:GntR family transcriptional regulator [Kribbella voronezhensis]TDU90447.1 DNA-binding GntR family transcriptional regulator [Kribbella voronezhensis]